VTAEVAETIEVAETVEASAATAQTEAGSDAAEASLNGGENTIMPPPSSAPPANGVADAPGPAPQIEAVDEQQ
jgi:hypothetical protein